MLTGILFKISESKEKENLLYYINRIYFHMVLEADWKYKALKGTIYDLLAN